MNASILVSVHPEHVANILSGKKVFEYRKVLPARNVSNIVLYSTCPVKKIVATAEVAHCSVGPPAQVWDQTAYGSGITYPFFIDYFAGHKKAGYFALGNVFKLSNPLEIDELLSCKVAPQSFCYLDSRDIHEISKMIPSVPTVESSF